MEKQKSTKLVEDTSEPSVLLAPRGWKSRNFSPLPVEGELFSLTFPFYRTGVITSVRFFFAFFGHFERYCDLTPTDPSAP